VKTLAAGLTIVCAFGLAACATEYPVQWTANLVTARIVVREGNVRGITDVFSFEGRIFVYATFTWEPGTRLGSQPIEVKWFNGETLISAQKSTVDFTKTPYYVWGSTSGTALGAGECRVEMYVNGKLAGRKDFTVTER